MSPELTQCTGPQSEFWGQGRGLWPHVSCQWIRIVRTPMVAGDGINYIFPGQALHADKTRRPLAPLLVSELQLL